MFALLDVLCKCYHAIDGLFWLASFRSRTFSRFIFSVDKKHPPTWTEPNTNPSPADGHHGRGLTLGSAEGRRCELSLASFMWMCTCFSRLSLSGRLCANVLGTSAVTAVELQDHWWRLFLVELSAPLSVSLSPFLFPLLSLSLSISLSLSLTLSPFHSVTLSLYVPFSLSVSLSPFLSLYLPFFLSVSLCPFVSLYLPFSISVSVCLSLCLSLSFSVSHCFSLSGHSAPAAWVLVCTSES